VCRFTCTARYVAAGLGASGGTCEKGAKSGRKLGEPRGEGGEGGEAALSKRSQSEDIRRVKAET
jgi:hypothetical protein